LRLYSFFRVFFRSAVLIKCLNYWSKFTCVLVNDT
jgi:hypothetical protein